MVAQQPGHWEVSGLTECYCTTHMNPGVRNQMWILSLGALTPVSEQWPLTCGFPTVGNSLWIL